MRREDGPRRRQLAEAGFSYGITTIISRHCRRLVQGCRCDESQVKKRGLRLRIWPTSRAQLSSAQSRHFAASSFRTMAVFSLIDNHLCLHPTTVQPGCASKNHHQMSLDLHCRNFALHCIESICPATITFDNSCYIRRARRVQNAAQSHDAHIRTSVIPRKPSIITIRQLSLVFNESSSKNEPVLISSINSHTPPVKSQKSSNPQQSFC